MFEKAEGAFLGAAVGDALGWPREFIRKRVGSANRPDPASRLFQAWTRLEGAPYFPHEIEISPGEYSDDTQLLLCTARSLLTGPQWWQHFTARELPTWTLYKRGGGGATKRAASAWTGGHPPWIGTHKERERDGYFQAGGNGVAMRILPHVLHGERHSEFAPIVPEIMANGISTHGHPRALVGALAYGYAAWILMRQFDELPYGWLIEGLLAGRDAWSTLPRDASMLHAWYATADEFTEGGYEALWWETVHEMEELLETCRTTIEEFGALPVGDEALARVGCFDKDRKGAGTIGAAAAILLASAYAADPFNGLLAAAFARGADTDTIASMAGGLLGALWGIEWLGEQAQSVQDAPYIRKIAGQVATNVPDLPSATLDLNSFAPQKAALDAVKVRVEQSTPGETITLPDGRTVVVCQRQSHRTRSAKTQAASWKLETVDGQTLYISKVGRQQPIHEAGSVNDHIDQTTAKSDVGSAAGVVRAGVRLGVRDIVRTRRFYADILGLNVVEVGDRLRLGSSISLAQMPRERDDAQRSTIAEIDPQSGTVLLIEPDSLDAVYSRAKHRGARITSPLKELPDRRSFQCRDPDGYLVELYDRRSTDVSAGDTHEPQVALADPSTAYATDSAVSGMPTQQTSSPGTSEPLPPQVRKPRKKRSQPGGSKLL